MDLKQTSDRLNKLLETAIQEEIQLNEEVQMDESIFDFKIRKRAQVIEEIPKLIDQLKVSDSITDEDLKENLDVNIRVIKESYKASNLNELNKHSKFLQELTSSLEQPKKEFNFQVRNLPLEIAEEVRADLGEAQKCYHASCYRSTVILCARILEVGLHRKYYESTGTDLLEKSPGIGLGKIIQKLKEKEVNFDPGLTQQIHLINNVRIHAVHKQSEIFNPTESQALAVMLFTKDVLEKLF